jgi:hypothetical protein
VLFLVLSMGPHLHVGGYVSPMPLPFRVLEKLPLLQNVQPRRLMLFTFLGAAVLVAVLVDELFKRRGEVAVAVSGTAALIVALVPVLPTFQYPASEVRLPSFFTSSQVERLPKGGVALIAPFARNTSTSEPMLWQAEADFRWRMPEGYILGPDDTGRFVFLPEPSSLSEAMGAVQGGGEPPPWTPDARAQYGRDLSDKHVRSIVVGPMLYEANVVAFFSELLGRPPERVGGVSLWLRVDGRAITRAASSAPSLPS